MNHSIKSNIVKTIANFLGTALILALILSCNKERSEGKMVVELTDAPGDYLEVNVEVIRVMAHYDQPATGSNGWVDLPTDTGVYNLLELQNNVTAVIANNSSMPLGHVNQMRLILGTQNNVMLSDSTIQPLLLSSQDKTGLKINVNTDITANNTVEIVLDFDADASVVKQGNDQYRLKPVIKVESVTVM
jgi:hypothetical protein